ncbi:hypothetical protein CWB96_03840 [Pseudoalteromonas citrea]|uniref:Bacterial mobilisation domain-containing protein n=1 Tax=Pseudoalteromonas citrea TaxID=43655 RepID=A0A5S3XSW0_9GAMM|nr:MULTISPECIES: plasmid mobilization relaxosome protein MobC [Pseudoalteromonas]MBR8842401.1 plasmid mobilization relaxosome protein MobC [Pseudoalteromonas sp. JC3]RZG14362.1 plasmid mobilization relaxosome protein MobC [Pseudoalteromonas sp. CO342X]TMP45192.1 hypothetical protein CWB97_05170 [Pseudoalteromonas citrea]TMP61427.1 hypothetical protein CWB96_03840 [Pseudoalteromonas citrea]WJE09479.1 plasmid mobilization relaxosome protein MobC [Pseudoalteromonas sp. JC3]
MDSPEHKKDYQKQYMAEFRKHHKRVELNFTLAEYRDFKKAAQQEKLTVSQTVKNMAMAYQQQHYFIPAELKEKLDTLHFLIRNVANNINQIAHRSNTLQVMVHENELLMELKKLEDLVTEYTLKGLKK